jgi:hypothetical protein
MNEELLLLEGQKITLFCLNYIYTGTLKRVYDKSILLENPAIVYETGAFNSQSYQDAQSLCVPEFYVSLNCIESFGVLK